MLVLPRINFHDAGAMRVVKQMGPAILGVSVSQISLIINTIFASFLASGSVSWMYYADRLMEFPSGVLAWRLAPFCCRRCRKVLPVAIMMNTTV